MGFTMFQNEETPFQLRKTRSSKSGKIEIFPKGLTQGFGQKMAIIPCFFFQAIQAKKMCFTIFQNEKTPFQLIKTKNSKSRKIEIFPKGLTHGFGQKMAIFPSFFLGNIGQENVFYDILERENAFIAYNNKFKKSKNSDFSQGVNRWFWSKTGHFSMFFLDEIQARKMCFTIFQNEKNAFIAYKKKSSKSRKLEIFPKGLTHSFGQKITIIPFFFRHYRPRKCVLRYS